ncbi:MAG: hypothetical protein RL173_1607 [Fibrobacterota bacterium]
MEGNDHTPLVQPDSTTIVTSSGRKFRSIDLLIQWLIDDTLKAIIRAPGSPDWPFQAMMPTSPAHLSRTLQSALHRNQALRSQCPPDFDRIGPQPPALPRLPRGLERVQRRLRNQDTWQVGRLESDPFQPGPAQVTPLFPAPGTLRADPFPLRWNDQDWILFEDMISGDRGRLRAALRRGSEWNVLPGEILPLPHHLSWPCPMDIDGSLYLLPESGEANEVALWECIDFPFQWKKRVVLLEGRHWHDPVFLHHQDLWWLFVSAGGAYDQDHSAELQAFWTRDPLREPLRPHALNPLSVSVAGSRPAGKPFEFQGTWIRPTQDCRAGYGTGIFLQRLDELTPTSWRETVVGRIAPPQGKSGIHTLNHLPGYGWIVDVT